MVAPQALKLAVGTYTSAVTWYGFWAFLFLWRFTYHTEHCRCNHIHDNQGRIPSPIAVVIHSHEIFSLSYSFFNEAPECEKDWFIFFQFKCSYLHVVEAWSILRTLFSVHNIASSLGTFELYHSPWWIAVHGPPFGPSKGALVSSHL